MLKCLSTLSPDGRSRIVVGISVILSSHVVQKIILSLNELALC
jgi:hypothetical protein